jgi:N-acetylmuramoyl-L-alanine amidase
MKVYISPSIQENNRGVGAYGTEEDRMFEIANVVIRELKKHKNIEIRTNERNFGANEIMRNSNGWADVHVAIHSNAGGGTGCEIFHYVDGTENLSLKLARKLYNKISAITPMADRGLKNGMNLFEVNDNIKAVSCLIEIAFHDNWADATFIIENIEKIGITIADGILEHLTVDRGIDTSLIQNPVIQPVVNEKIVYVDKIIEKPVEIIKYVEKIVEKPIEKIVYKDKIVEKEIVKEVTKEFTFAELMFEIIKYIKRIFKKADVDDKAN